ncbi:MAG: hypothetical protein ACP5G0_08525 [Desulfomonilia bacterium]
MSEKKDSVHDRTGDAAASSLDYLRVILTITHTIEGYQNLSA